MNYSIEVIADAGNRCGEGPIWDDRKERLIWTDIDGGKVFTYWQQTDEWQVINDSLVVSGIALDESGDLIFVGGSKVHLWTNPLSYVTFDIEVEGETVTFNDIVADPKGRIYAGTINWGANGMEKPGALYLIDTDASIRLVVEGIELSNGLGFSPDDRTLYYADSAARRIYAYEVNAETGELSNKRVFVQVPRDEGLPDGLTVDAEGCVWSAQWYGAQVVRYDPEGKVERRISMPVTQVSSVAFGGRDRNELYITSAGDPWSSSLAPSGYNYDTPNIGGSLYRVKLDIQGRLEHRAALTISE